MRLNRTTLIFAVEIGVLLGTGFVAGYLWPHPSPDLVVSRTPTQAELTLSVDPDDQTSVNGTAPAQTTLSVDGDTIREGEGFTLNGASNLQWWTDEWAVVLELPEITPGTIAASSDGATASELERSGKFVASSSGTKYHPVEGCSFADRIKPENKIYFDSEEQAKAAGYEPSSCLTK